jgi:hypothetical protein
LQKAFHHQKSMKHILFSMKRDCVCVVWAWISRTVSVHSLMKAWSTITCWPRHWTLGPWIESLLVDLSFFTSFRKSYLFHSLNLEACSLHLIEWDRIDIVERWIDTDQSLHLDRSEDDKTICEERALIDDLFFWISSIILTRDEIRDHLSRFFLYLTQIFIFISLFSLLCSSRANWIQAIYSFESRFDQIRVASQSEHLSITASHQTLAKSLRSQSILPRISSR